MAQTAPAGGTAVVAHPSWGTPRIDPRITTLFAHRARFGETIAAFRRSPRFERDANLPLVIRFDRAPASTELNALVAAGVTFGRARRPLFSGAYSARSGEAGIAALERDPNVARVEVDLPLAGPRPLDRSAVETRIADARRALLARDGTDLDGHGVVIGDVDTGAFIFHPAFFRADAGSFPWVDMNGNGRFDPGVDGVDLDRNGEVAHEEIVQRLPATFYDVYDRPMNGTSPALRPDRDWLYCDTNDNQTRDYGPPFDDSTPAFGEPLFVLDDANHDGIAQPSEHLLRLGTSKFRAVMGTFVFTRGSTGNEALVNAYDSTADVGHGTGVAGILVGGVPHVSQLLGLAPGAEMLLADDRMVGENVGTTGSLQWEMDEGANVLLTEYAPYAYVTLDGTSEEELLLDSALDQNVVPVSPAGNLAQGHKHQAVQLVAGDNDIPAHTQSSFAGGRLIQISLHHRVANRALTFSLVLPGGRVVVLPPNAPGGQSFSGGFTAYTNRRVSPRGTTEQHVLFYRGAGLAEGDYTIRVTLDAGDAVDADLYVADDRTSWGGGFELVGNDVPRTLCHPATSDRTLTVAAYVLHGEEAYGAWGAQGVRANYSSRGPRIDDGKTIDIAAPDNPMSTASIHGDVPYGAYTPFGGTSGAGPHVAASVALLRQLDPTASGQTLRERIIAGARADDVVRAGSVDEWGAGRLDLATAAMLTPASASIDLHVALQAPSEVVVGAPLQIVATVTGAAAPATLRYRWDLDNDGTNDTDWLESATQSIGTATPSTRDVRVEVRDRDGNYAAATARVRIVPPPAVDPDAGVPLRSVEVSGGCTCSAGIGRFASDAPTRGFAAVTAVLALIAARRRSRVGASKKRTALAGIPRDC